MADKKQKSKCKIELKDIKKSFGTKIVLDGINLQVNEGKSLVVIGGSGTGKSVMLKCLLGIMAPDDGEITYYDNSDNINNNAKKSHHTQTGFYERIGMLFQGSASFDSLNVWQNVAFRQIQHQHLPKKQAIELAVDKLSRVGLKSDVAELYPSELSGGMQKRVALARAIANDPEIIFFDEPTTGLDPIMANVINELIVELVNDLGATTITITHDIASARLIADEVAMIYHGKIIWDGAVEKLDKSGNEYLAQFITGNSEGPIIL